MVLNLIVAEKFTELLLFEVRCKKRDGAAAAAGAGAGSMLYLLWISNFGDGLTKDTDGEKDTLGGLDVLIGGLKE